MPHLPARRVHSGIQEIESDNFRLRCLQTPTGLKFYVVAHPDAKGLDSTLNDIYQVSPRRQISVAIVWLYLRVAFFSGLSRDASNVVC